jgi:dynein heavy chain
MQASPSAFWISSLFFPQGLLTAILQTYARKTKVPIDTLAFKFKVVDVDREKLPPPKDGAYIYGLFFAGARWDSSKDTMSN